MRKIYILLILFFFNYQTISISAENIKRIFEGNHNAKIKIIAYESLTCSFCADFHTDIYPDLKKDFIDKGLVKIEFRHFPLDLAAFNASKIAQCKNDGDSNLLHILYSNQKEWAKGKSVEEANINLENFIKVQNLDIDYNKCKNDKDLEDFILNDRIEGVKKFNVNATPTIIINNKKFEKSLNYKNLTKTLEKLI